MKRLSRLPQTRFGSTTAIFVVCTLVFAACGVLPDNGDRSSSEPDLVVAAKATLTARESQHQPTPTATPRAPNALLTSTSVEVSSTCDADTPIDGLPPGLPLGYTGNTAWYGSSTLNLWASPVDFGSFLSDGFEESAGLWFAGQTEVMWYGAALPIQLNGEQLDGDATVGPIEVVGAASQVQWTDVLIPEPGCWQLTGSTETSELTFIVEVMPVGQRPDFKLIQSLYDARPYEAPETCAITPWAGPEARGDENFAHFWLESNGISADVGGWFVAGDQQSMGVYGDEVVKDLNVTLRGLDPGSRTETQISTVILNSDGRLLRFVFPSAGCWELELATDSSTASFIIYAYPTECRPIPEDGAFLVSCEAP
jgi:hypothetical protein